MSTDRSHMTFPLIVCMYLYCVVGVTTNPFLFCFDHGSYTALDYSHMLLIKQVFV